MCPLPTPGPAPAAGDLSVLTDVVIPLTAVLVGAMLAWLTAWATSRGDRRASSQLSALNELQVQSVALRRAYRDWGAEPEHTDESEKRLDEALEWAQIVVRRVRCETLHGRFTTWADVSGPYWDGDEVPTDTEERLWTSLQDGIVEELRRFD